MTIVRAHKGSAIEGKRHGVSVAWKSRADLCNFLDFWAEQSLDNQRSMEFDFAFTNAYIYFTSDDARNAFLNAWNGRMGNDEHSSVQTAP